MKKNIKDLLDIEISDVIKPYKCEYCNVAYAKESTLLVHSCEKKRRFLSQSDINFRMAFTAYNKFYQSVQQCKKEKTINDFINSRYYNAFIKFGSFLSNVKPLYPDKYIQYIISSGLKIDHWCKDENYYKYVEFIVYDEPVETALDRSIRTMDEWATSVNSQWNHYFKYVNPVKSLLDLRDGKISPWLVLNCKSGIDMIGKYTDKELNMIYNIIDPKKWTSIFSNQKSDLEFVINIVKSGNL